MYQYGTAWGRPQQPVLPPGWESKWDPNTRRLFYINHATKTTQWELPTQAASATPKNVSTSVEPDSSMVRMIVSEYYNVSTQLAESLLRVNQNDLANVRSTLSDRGYSKKKKVEPKENFVRSLQSTFPSAPVDIIREVLVNTSNNFAGARTSLEAMGYKRGTALPTAKSSKASKIDKQATSPTKVGSTESSTKTNTKLSNEEKQKRLQVLKRQFASLDESLIELALIGTKYDVELSATLLKSSIESVKDSSKSTAQSSTSYTSSTVFGFSSQSSLSPVVFGEEEPKEQTSPKREFPSNSITTDTPKKEIQSVQPKFTQRSNAAPKKYKIAPRRTPQPGTYISPLRTTPQGPSPGLYMGPNYSLLLQTRVKAMGPNKRLQTGPQSKNRCGPLRSNHRGRAGIDVGPVR